MLLKVKKQYQIVFI